MDQLDKILTLINAGYSREEITALLTPAPAPAPAVDVSAADFDED